MVLLAVTSLALVALALLALGATVDHNAEVRRRAHEELRGELREHILRWDLTIVQELDRLVDEVDQELEAGGHGGEGFGMLEARFDRHRRWFDSLYVWSHPAASRAPGAQLYPPPAPPELTGPAESACLDAARRFEGLPPSDALIATLREGCEAASPRTRATATNLSARLAHAQGGDGPRLALALLDLAPLPENAPLRTSQADPALTREIAMRRVLRAEMALQGGQAEDGLEQLRRLLEDISALDAPALAASLLTARVVEHLLQSRGQGSWTPAGVMARAERRLEAWRYVSSHTDADAGGALLGAHTPDATPGGAVIAEPWGDGGGVLYVRAASPQRHGVALLLDAEDLAASFLRSEDGRFRGALAVSDGAGRRVAGVDAPTTDELSEPLGQLLMGLRVAPTEALTQARVQPLLEPWWSLRTVVTTISIVLGFGALWAFARADREHEALLHRQREFTTRVTHELKTPLAGIKVMAENMAMGAFRDEDHLQSMADHIVREADRLTARINEVLQLSRGPAITRQEPVDLEEVVLECVDEWGPRYDQVGIILHADLDVTEPVLGDPRALRDAMVCLLDNALKYRREDIEPHVWLTVRPEGAQAVIEVADNGIGVPTELRQSIFDRFVRVEGPNRGKSGGHGLGLAQVREIVAAHRGTVSCEDGMDGGARFVIRLPTKA
jgi:signal transduction histidine kinase